MGKITSYTAATALTADDVMLVVDSPGSSPATKKVAVSIVQRDTQGGVAYTWPGADGSNGQVLTTNGAGVLSWGAGGGSLSLDNLTNVTITTPTTGDLLRYNGSAWVNYAGSNYAAASHTHAAADITDFSTAADARVAAAIGVSVQAYDADLAAIAGLTGVAGSLIRHNGSAWVVYADSNYAAASHTHTASQVTDFDTEVSNNADVAANTSARHAAVTLAGSLDYLTLTGQEITRGAIDLATDITLLNLAQFDILYGASSTGLSRLGGNTAATNKFLRSTGTGAAAQAPSWETLQAGDIPDLSGTYQPLDADLTALAALSSTGILKRTGAATYGYVTDNSSNWDAAYTASHAAVTIAAGRDYISITGQELTLGAVDLAADVTGTLPAANGGTSFSTYATGDLIYASAANTLSKLAVGASPDGYVLTLASGVPSWAAATGGSSAWTHATTYTTLDNAGDNVGINAGASPAAKLHVIATTEQLRLGYDASNYLSVVVDSAGDAALTTTGGDFKVNGLNLYYDSTSDSIYISPTARPTFAANSRNVVIGETAGDAISTGTLYNTLIGWGAGGALSTSSTQNVAVGYSSLVAATSAANLNTAVGSNALYQVSTGDNNTGIGYAAGGGLTTGSYGIFIGNEVSAITSSGNRQLVIGDAAYRAIWSENFALGLNIGGPNTGQGTGIKMATTLLSAMSGATVTATNLIPAGSFVLGVTTRVTTLITGATTFDVGDGTDVDRWGAAIAVAAGTTTSAASFTAAASDYPHLYTAATSVVLTANGGNFSAGAVRVTVHYFDLTAATS